MIIIIHIFDFCLASLRRKSQKNEIDVFILTTRFEKYSTTKDLIELYIREEYFSKHSSFTAKHKNLHKAIVENVRNPDPLNAKNIFKECYLIVASDLLGKVLKVNKRKKHIEDLRAEFSKNYILCYDKLISEVYNLSFDIDIDLNEKKEKDIECDERVFIKVLTHLIFHFIEFYLKNQILDKQAYLIICQKINAYSLGKIIKKYLKSNLTKYIKCKLIVRIEECKVLGFFQKSRIIQQFNKVKNIIELESISSYLIFLDPFSFINMYVNEDMNYFEYYAKFLFVGLHSFSKLINKRPVEKLCDKKIIGTTEKNQVVFLDLFNVNDLQKYIRLVQTLIFQPESLKKSEMTLIRLFYLFIYDLMLTFNELTNSVVISKELCYIFEKDNKNIIARK